MVAAIGRIGRHEIGDIAHHEHLAGAGIEDGFRGGAGIAAGDHHDRGLLLALAKLEIAFRFGRVTPFAEIRIAIEKPFWQGH